jgi:hypothetical protein
MVVEAIIAATTVNVFITIIIHQVDGHFGFHSQEKELLEYFIIQLFFRVKMI